MKSKFFTIFLLMLLMFYANSTLASEGHDEPIADMTGGHEAADQCTTPTLEVTITSGENMDLVYDQKEYKVPKNTCIELIFVNIAIIEHDVSINEVHDVLAEVHIHLANNTDGHDLDGVKSMHIQTPDKDTEFDIFCSVLGHEAAGMTAKLIVGEGNPEDNSLPGFGFLVSLFALSTLIITYRKKQN